MSGLKKFHFNWQQFISIIIINNNYHYLIIIIIIIISSLECIYHQTLSDYDRAASYKEEDKCDNTLPKGWYRFTGLAGVRMADACVTKYRCGTHAPGWLDGGHPTVGQGRVKRKVCYHGSSGCCQWSNDILVRNCGSFYVYYLTPTPTCNLRYCGDHGLGNV